MKRNRKHIVKTLLRIAAVTCFVLLLAFASFITYYAFTNAESLSRDFVSAYVFQNTNGDYRVSYEKINVVFRERRIEIEQLEVIPQKTVPEKQQYAFNSNKIALVNIRPIPFIRHKRFVADLLEFDTPEIWLSTGERVEAGKIEMASLSKGDSLSIPFFSEIFFDTVRVRDANVFIDTLSMLSHEMPVFNIEATHFKLGGRKFTDIPYPFDVSDLSLMVSEVNWPMPDSLHTIYIGKMNFSLLTRLISANNVRLSPVEGIETPENLFTVDMPNIHISSLMADHFLKTDTVSIDLMEIINPSISIKFGTKVRQGTPVNEINLHKLIENKLKWVSIEQFNVLDAELSLFEANSEQKAQHIENLDIRFSNFYSDSLSYSDPGRLFSAESVEIALSKYTLNHVDQIHYLEIHDIIASSVNDLITAGAVVFAPLPGINASEVSTLINTTAQSITFVGVDFLSFYHLQEVPMEKFVIEQPVTKLGFQQRYFVETSPKDKSIILEKTSDYLRGIYVDSTQIDNGYIEYTYITGDDEEGFFSTRYNFSLSQLSIDSVTFFQSDKIFFAENFDVNFAEIGLQLAGGKHSMHVESMNLSSQGKRAEILGIKIKPSEEGLDEVFDIYFPRIQLSGANLHHAFFKQELFISNLTIFQPVFNIVKHGKWASEERNNPDYENEIFSLVSDYLNRINVKNLNMRDGLLNLEQYVDGQADFKMTNKFSATLYNFEIDANASRRDDKLFFSDDIDLVLKNHAFTLADGVHKLVANEIGILSTKNEVYVRNANLYPDVLSPGFENMHMSVFANMPLLKISGADIFSLINKGVFDVEELRLNNPSIRLLYKKDADKRVKPQSKPAIILEGLKSASSKKVVIQNGKLELADYIAHKSVPFANTLINFELDNLQLSYSDNIFDYSYNDFHILFNTFSFDLPDKIHRVSIGEIDYRLSTEQLDLRNIEMKPLKANSLTERKQYFDLKIPLLTIAGFDFDKYLSDNSIETQRITVQDPFLRISDNRVEKGAKFSPYNLNLYKTVSPFANLVTVSEVHLNNGSVLPDSNKPLKINNINISAKGFRIDEHEEQNRFLNSDFAEMSIKNFNGNLENGYFKYRIGEIQVNTTGSFNFSDMSLTPLVSRDEYARIKQFETDFFTITNADVSGEGFDLKSFSTDGSIYIDRLSARFDSVAIHRNKTYPLNPAQRPPMPQQAIKDLKHKLKIDDASISVSYFEYTELETGAIDTSYVFFTDVDAAVKNIRNINVADKPLMTANFEAKLMGVGHTVINTEWNLQSFSNEFTLEAICYEMPLAVMNPITEPSLNLSIREGINRKLEVSFKANGDSSAGTMRFAYNDLKVGVLSTRGGEVREDRFISFLVNTLALRSDNPRRGRILLPVRFQQKRDKQRSVVGFCWRSVYAGIQASLGMKEKADEESDNEVDN